MSKLAGVLGLLPRLSEAKAGEPESVGDSGLEPLTSGTRILRATNCANLRSFISGTQIPPLSFCSSVSKICALSIRSYPEKNAKWKNQKSKIKIKESPRATLINSCAASP